MDKNTKKKQEINAILEKYNLKRTKTNAVPDNNFQITPKSDSQIIHVSKSLPNSTSTSPSTTATVKTVTTPVNKVNIEPDVKSLLDKDKKEIIQQKINMPQAVLSKSNSKNTPKNFNLYGSSDTSTNILLLSSGKSLHTFVKEKSILFSFKTVLILLIVDLYS